MSLYAPSIITITTPDGTHLQLTVTHLKMEAARLDEDVDHRPFTLCANVLGYTSTRTTSVPPPIENVEYEKLAECGTPT